MPDVGVGGVITRTVTPDIRLLRPNMSSEDDESNYIPTDNNNEQIKKLRNIFEGYFIRYVSHAVMSYPTMFDKPSLATYCRISSPSAYVTKDIILQPIKKLYKGKYSFFSLLDEKFFDKPDHILMKENVYLGYGTEYAVKIILPIDTKIIKRKETIGYYLTEKQILITTDWSNSNLTVDFVNEHMLSTLIKELDLRKIVPRKRLLVPVKITIGCDPEFELLDMNKNVIDAASKVKSSHSEFGLGNKIGLDGHSAQVEFRPAAGTPDEVVDRLEYLFDKFGQLYHHSLAVSGHREPLGGHIHVGVNRRVTPPRMLLNLLDDFLGSPTLPLSGRARSEYKLLSQHREKNWGFEYRTPPAIIFYNATLARISLTLVHNLCYKFFNSKRLLTYNVPVGTDDLVNVGGITRNEATYFLNKLKVLKRDIDAGNVVVAKWHDNDSYIIDTQAPIEVKKQRRQRSSTVIVPNVPTIERGIRIMFADDWSQEIRNEFTTELTQHLTDTNSNNVTIILFGFRENRGFVSNIPIAGFSNTPFASTLSTDAGGRKLIKIGLPYAFRQDLEIYNRNKLEVKTGILNFLNSESSVITSPARRFRAPTRNDSRSADTFLDDVDAAFLSINTPDSGLGEELVLDRIRRVGRRQ